jgi:cell division septum initiation protein DivIVA
MTLSHDVTRPRSPQGAGTDANAAVFDTALRGYDRRQVDELIAAQREQIARLQGELAESERRQRAAADHAAATETEVRNLRATIPAQSGAPVEEGFGFRAEKLLRLAEQEAADMRAHSSRESVAVLERARAEAEKHRHDVEQSLIARAAQLDEKASRRSIELAEREQQMAASFEASKSEAAEQRAAASRAADRMRQEAEAAAADITKRAQSEVARMRQESERDLNRLRDLRTDVQNELARLAEVLVNELPSAAAPRHAGVDSDADPVDDRAGEPAVDESRESSERVALHVT